MSIFSNEFRCIYQRAVPLQTVAYLKSVSKVLQFYQSKLKYLITNTSTHELIKGLRKICISVMNVGYTCSTMSFFLPNCFRRVFKKVVSQGDAVLSLTELKSSKSILTPSKLYVLTNCAMLLAYSIAFEFFSLIGRQKLYALKSILDALLRNSPTIYNCIYELLLPQRFFALPIIREYILTQVASGVSSLFTDEKVMPDLQPSNEIRLYPLLNPFQSVYGQPMLYMYCVNFTLMGEIRIMAKEMGNKSQGLGEDSQRKSDNETIMEGKS